MAKRQPTAALHIGSLAGNWADRLAFCFVGPQRYALAGSKIVTHYVSGNPNIESNTGIYGPATGYTFASALGTGGLALAGSNTFDPGAAQQGLTFVCVVHPKSPQSFADIYCGSARAGVTWTGSGLRFLCDSGTGWNATYSTEPALVNNQQNSFVVSSSAGSSNVAGNERFSVNGGSILANTNISTPLAINGFSVGGSSFLGVDTADSANRNFWGNIYLVALFARAFTDAEIMSVSANPWQLFAPPRRRIFLGPAAGAPDNLWAQSCL